MYSLPKQIKQGPQSRVRVQRVGGGDACYRCIGRQAGYRLSMTLRLHGMSDTGIVRMYVCMYVDITHLHPCMYGVCMETRQ